jgi:hypothetical protein
MPKIIKNVSGSNLSEEPFKTAFGPSLPENPLPPPPVERKEIAVTPNPTTRQQHHDNAKAGRHREALKRQFQAQPAADVREIRPHASGLSNSQARRRRRQKRAVYKLAVRLDLAAGKITKAEAEKLLSTDRNRDNSRPPSER